MTKNNQTTTEAKIEKILKPVLNTDKEKYLPEWVFAHHDAVDQIMQLIAKEKKTLLAEAERLIAGIKPIHPYDDVTDPINTAYQRSIQTLRMLAHSQEDREGVK